MDSEILDPELETLSHSELCEREEPRLAQQIEYVMRHSAFYQTKFGKSKHDHLGDKFEAVPFTEKHEIIDDQTAHPPFGRNLCVPQSKVQRIHRTSGTTGRPVLIALTREDSVATIASGRRCFWAAGLRPGDIVFHCLNYCMWMGGLTDHLSLEATGATVVPYGVGNSRNLIDAMLTIKPTALHCTFSYLAKLEQLLKTEFSLGPRDLGLKKGLFAGEGGIQDPDNRAHIEQVWGLKAMDANYGISDVLSMFGAECSRQSGMHFMGQGNLYIELIDPDTSLPLPVERGVQGEFVLTTLGKVAQPLIRFRTHDVVEILDHGRCDCGRRSFRFKILGRSDDMIVVKGINLFPSAIGTVVSKFLPQVTGEYQVVVNKGMVVKNLSVRVEVRGNVGETTASELKLRLQEAIRQKFDVKAEIEIVPEGHFPRTEEKTRRLIRL